MPVIDPRVDAYIEKSNDFAKPILRHIRALVHEACPDLTETMKWSFPHFDYKGMFCSMASFKAHCAFGFWKHSLMDDAALPSEKTAMGSFGRITAIADLPDDETMKSLIIKAIKLNDDGIKVVKAKPTAERKEMVVPAILIEALARDEAAAATFEKFPYSKRKDYVEWITDAKSETTREKRLATMIEWLAEGKARHWKYENC
ncbi:MAG: YdeI/OmpD-associated family protein [Pyrinomonadaceae bacterium]